MLSSDFSLSDATILGDAFKKHEFPDGVEMHYLLRKADQPVCLIIVITNFSGEWMSVYPFGCRKVACRESQRTTNYGISHNPSCRQDSPKLGCRRNSDMMAYQICSRNNKLYIKHKSSGNNN